MPTREFNAGATKVIFDQLIDRHAEAYIEAYPEVREFNNFDKSGTINSYIGMVWTSDNEKPNIKQLRIRGSQAMTKNKLVELDLSSVTTEQAFFPGQVVAFSADPFLKQQLVVRKFYDPIKVAPAMKKIYCRDQINLIVASGPFMKPEVEDWTLLDKLIEEIKNNNGTHVILIGPFVDMVNRNLKVNYELSWRTVFNKLAEGLFYHQCTVYLIPSNRDILPSHLASNYQYPCPALDVKLNIKDGLSPKCQIRSMSDPSQIDLGGLYLDVTSAEILFHSNNCMSVINRGSGNSFTPIFKHVIVQGIYPLYPAPREIAINYTQLQEHTKLDRLGAHIVVLPTRFNTPPVFDVDHRIIVTTQKCSVKRQMILIEIPRIEGDDESAIESLVYTNYSHKVIELIPKTPEEPSSELIENRGSEPEQLVETESKEGTGVAEQTSQIDL